MATSLEELNVLKTAEKMADSIWEIVSDWDTFERETIASQIVRASDSIQLTTIAQQINVFAKSIKAQRFGRQKSVQKTQTKYNTKNLEANIINPEDINFIFNL